MNPTDTVLQMLQQRQQQGPTLINNYQSALATAAGQDQQSIDQLRGIYSDPSKFNRSKLTSFGLGLMAPTANGRISDSMFNGLAAAVETQNFNQQANLTREEKLAGLAAIEAKLTRQKADDTMSVYDKQTGYITNALTDRNTMADLQLGNNMPGSRPLAAGEQGPVAPDQTPFGRAQLIYNDYLTNPSKYAGPQGQSVVTNAIEILKNERTNSRYERVAGMKNAEKPTISGPEQRRVSKRIGELDTAAEDARDLRGSVAALQAARSKTESEGGIGADLRATVFGWFGVDDAEAMQQVRSQATDMKLNLSQKLKGAISNAEQGMLENATPGLGMTDAAATPILQGYDLAATRVMERAKFVRAWVQKNGDDYGADEAWDQYVNENPIIAMDERGNGNWTVKPENVGNWQRYVIDVNAEDGPARTGVDPSLGFDPAVVSEDDKAWAREQIEGGADPAAVMEELRSTYGTQQ